MIDRTMPPTSTPPFIEIGSRWVFAGNHRRWGGRVLTVVGRSRWGAIVGRYDGSKAPTYLGLRQRFLQKYVQVEQAPHLVVPLPRPRVECKERL